MERNYKIDNIRFILIFFVVLGHFLECFNETNKLYLIIYSFHMPVFLFISGYFAKFNIKKIISFLYLYILFQILYSIFSNSSIQFSTPFWLLWYLFVIIIYYLLVPIFDNKDNQLVIIFVAIVGSLLSGFINEIGYYGSLSRLLTFLPFFSIGYHIGHNEKLKNLIQKNLLCNKGIKIINILMIIICTIYISFNTKITANILYGSYSYEFADYNLLIKLNLLFVAFTWILFFFIWTPNKKINFVSTIGKNTLFIFLFHGFIVILAKKYILFDYSFITNLVLAVLLTLLIILLFGNKTLIKYFNKIFTVDWIFNLYNKFIIK